MMCVGQVIIQSPNSAQSYPTNILLGCLLYSLLQSLLYNLSKAFNISYYPFPFLGSKVSAVQSLPTII